MPEEMNTATEKVLFTGSFESAAHPTNGTVRVVETSGTRKLVFENFKTDPGPDLDVYLSDSQGASTFINLGDLKATSGKFEYTIASTVDLKTTKHVLIWCVTFSVLFGHAELKMN